MTPSITAAAWRYYPESRLRSAIVRAIKARRPLAKPQLQLFGAEGLAVMAEAKGGESGLRGGAGKG